MSVLEVLYVNLLSLIRIDQHGTKGIKNVLSENGSVYHNEKCINFLSHVWLTMLPGAFRT